MADDESRRVRNARNRIRVGPLTTSAAAELQRKAGRQGWHCARVDLSGCIEKKEMLERLASALEFPGSFGRNWEGLFDGLADLSWRPAAGHVLLVEHAERLRQLAPEVFDTTVAILQDVAVYWARRNVTFRAFVGVSTPE